MVCRLGLLAALLTLPAIQAAPAPHRLSHSNLLDEKFIWKRDGTGNNGTTAPGESAGYNGAAATEVGICSDVGVSILKQGGNAADGMIAQALCVGTIAAYHSGIGGGGFAIIRYLQDNGSVAYEEIDFRETMPAAGNETMYSSLGDDQTASTIGGLAVGVPGELRAWEKLHSRHGKLSWEQLFQPAIKLAREGFPVNIDLAYAIATHNVTSLDPLFAESYAPNGTALVEGDTCYRKRYANTLETLSKQGADAFYQNSNISENIVSAVQKAGGILTAQDLANYTAIIRQPHHISYKGQKVYSTIAPSSGTVILSALKIFEGLDHNSSADASLDDFNKYTHQIIEANKFAYGQRTTYGDPAFIHNVTELESYYLSDEVVEENRQKIKDNTTFGVSYYIPQGSPNAAASREAGTSHMAIIDKSGMAISLTTTVNLYWGSQVMTEDGIILNDEMDDFSSPGQTNSFGFASSATNFIAPGKRPQSSISSAIAEDANGEVSIVTGSAGGSRIITATLQELLHHLDNGYNASECVHQPRWHDQLSGKTYFELPSPSLGLEGFNNDTVHYLAGLGYNTTYEDLTGSTSHVIVRFSDGLLDAASDPRKAAGFGAAY